MIKEELDRVALAYTVKESTASTPEQFLNDYIANKELFKEANAKFPIPKAKIHKRSDFGL